MLTVASAQRQLARLQCAPTPAPARVRLEVYREHMLGVLREYGIEAEWRRVMPIGVGGYAISRSKIVCPPMEDEAGVAVVAHEIGHCLAEPCHGALHQRDRQERDWHKCLQCETLAWATGIALMRPLPWTQQMHRRLTHALKSYRRCTPGPAAAIRYLDSLAAPITYFRVRQSALETAMRPIVPTTPPRRIRTWAEDRDEDRWRDFFNTLKEQQT